MSRLERLTEYQQLMEKFYDDMASTIQELGMYHYLTEPYEEVKIQEPDLVVFDFILHQAKYDDQLETLLQAVMDKGYRILVNFAASDVVIGNIMVRLKGRWFAFGDCISYDDIYSVRHIWPLNYVLPRLSRMEVTPKYVASLS